MSLRMSGRHLSFTGDCVTNACTGVPDILLAMVITDVSFNLVVMVLVYSNY